MADAMTTKRSIAKALKELCQKKSFEKISIADITGLCHLNRQTFYYHFVDKYELLSWIYYNECFLSVVEDITIDNWNEKLKDALDIMCENKKFYVNTIKQEEDIFTNYLYDITHTLFYELATKLDERHELSEESKTFFAEFFAFGICGVVVTWAKGDMKMPPAMVSLHLKQMAEHCENLAFLHYTKK